MAFNAGRYIFRASKSLKQQAENVSQSSSSFRDSLDKIFDSIKELFAPFIKVILNMMPWLSPIVTAIELIAYIIKCIIIYILLFATAILLYVKRKLLKYILAGALVLFIIHLAVSRIINSDIYKAEIEKAISQAINYDAKISGSLDLDLFPSLGFTLHDVRLSMQADSDYSLSRFNANLVNVSFSYLYLFLGQLHVKDVVIAGSNISILIGDKLSDSQDFKRSLSEAIQVVSDKYNNLESANREDIAKAPGSYKSKEKDSFLSDQTIASKPNNKSSVISSVNSFFIQRMHFDFVSVKNARIVNSNLHFFSGDIEVLTVNNVNFTLAESVLGSTKITGKINTSADVPLVYDLKLKRERDNFTVDGYLLFDEFQNGLDKIWLNGNTQSGIQVKANSTAVHNIISLIQEDSSIKSQKTDFMYGVLTFKEGFVDFSDIVVRYNGYESKSSMKWYYAGNTYRGIDFQLELNAKQKDRLLKQYSTNYEYNRGYQPHVSFVISNFDDIYSKILGPFNYKFIKGKIFMKDIGPQKNHMNFEFVRDPENTVYINDLSYESDNRYKITSYGTLEPSSIQGSLIVNASGSLEALQDDMQFNNKVKASLSAISEDSKNFDFKGKANINLGKIDFNDAALTFDKTSFKAFNMDIEQMQNSIFVKLAMTFDSIKFEYLSNIVNSVDSTPLENIDESRSNMFGLPENLNINLNLLSRDLTVKNIDLKNFAMNANVTKSGVNINSFYAESPKGGTLRGAASTDKKLLPPFAANVILDRFIIDTADYKNLIFKDFDIIGSVVLNGSLKGYGKNYTEFLSGLEGNISFMKLERLKANRTNDSDGFFLTLSNDTKNSKKFAYLNDIYGNLSIVSGRVDFFPVYMQYIDKGKTYRGAFKGYLNLKDQNIDLVGNMSDIKNSKDSRGFKVNGDIADPKILFGKNVKTDFIPTNYAEPQEEDVEESEKLSAFTKEARVEAKEKVQGDLKRIKSTAPVNATADQEGYEVEALEQSANVLEEDINNIQRKDNIKEAVESIHNKSKINDKAKAPLGTSLDNLDLDKSGSRYDAGAGALETLEAKAKYNKEQQAAKSKPKPQSTDSNEFFNKEKDNLNNDARKGAKSLDEFRSEIQEEGAKKSRPALEDSEDIYINID